MISIARGQIKLPKCSVYTLKGVTIKTTNTIYKILKREIVARIGL